MMISPVFAAFEEKVYANAVGYEPAKAGNVDDALNEAWTRYNHAVPGETGDLAEKHNTRSLSVGDVVLVSKRRADQLEALRAGKPLFVWTRYFIVGMAGFDEVTKNGYQTWVNTVPQQDRSFGVGYASEKHKIETPPPVPKAGMGATMQTGSDRSAYTISRVSKGGKTFWMKRDIPTRIDSNGISENQEYSYLRDLNASEERVSLRKNGVWRASGYDTTGSVGLGFRAEYRDPHF